MEKKNQHQKKEVLASACCGLSRSPTLPTLCPTTEDSLASGLHRGQAVSLSCQPAEGKVMLSA